MSPEKDHNALSGKLTHISKEIERHYTLAKCEENGFLSKMGVF